MVGFDGKYWAEHPKTMFAHKKSALKHSIEKSILYNFAKLYS